MNLLEIGLKLKAENIQSFIDDFLKIDDIVISDIQLHDDMILINKIKYKSILSLSLGLKIERVEDGIVSIIVKKLKAINIPISVMPVNFILKIILGKLNIPGVYSDGKQICIDLKTILKEYNVDFLALSIKDIQITKEDINIVIDDIDFNIENLLSKNQKKKTNNSNTTVEEIRGEVQELKQEIENLPKVEKEIEYVNNINQVNDIDENYNYHQYVYDGPVFDKNSKGYFNQYSRVRNKVYKEKFKDLNKETIGKIVFALPDIAVLCYRLLRDKRISKSLKILVGFTVTYLLSPWDFFSKKDGMFSSIFSKIDDGLLLIFTLSKIFTSIDINILKSHFEGDEEILNFLIDMFDVLYEFLGIDRINKIYAVVEKFVR